MTLKPFQRDPSEPYDPHLDAYLSWQDAIAAIRMRKLLTGEIQEEPPLNKFAPSADERPTLSFVPKIEITPKSKYVMGRRA